MAIPLTTLDRVKTRLRITGTDQDAYLTQLIADAEDYTRRYCRRDFDGTQERTELYNGLGSRVLVLYEAPVASVSEIKVELNTGYGSGYRLDNDTAELFRDAGRWPLADQAVEVTYTGGYTDVPTEAPSLSRAVETIVATWYREGGDDPNIISENFITGSFTRAATATGADALARAHSELESFVNRSPN